MALIMYSLEIFSYLGVFRLSLLTAKITSNIYHVSYLKASQETVLKYMFIS